jgi:hypothetical protein
MRYWVLFFWMAGFTSHGFAQDNGGVALGMVASAKHQFDIEVDYLDRVAEVKQPKQFDVLRYSLAASFWQAKETGQDISIEAGYCRGFQWHGCLGLGIRRQNADTTCIQSTLEFGTGFLFSIFMRPLIKIQESSSIRKGNQREDFEAEFGVKFKWPVWTF